MSEEIKNTAEQAPVATEVSESKDEVKTEAKPFKVYASEDEYKKDAQSLSSKAKYALLQELNVKNLEEARAKFSELEFTKSELKALNDIKAELDTAKAEKQKLSENLLLTELGVKTELRDDFLTLAKSKVDEKTPLPDAAKSVLEKYTYFKGQESPTQVVNKIGTPKVPSAPLDLKNDEKERLIKKFPHLRNKI